MMGILNLVMRKNFRIPVRDLGIVALLGLLYGCTSLGLLLSYNYIPTGVATTIHFLYPLVVSLVMILFFREKSSVWVFLSIIMSLAGVALMANGDGVAENAALGLFFVGTTVFSYAIYIVGVMKTRASRIDSTVLAFYVLCFTTMLFVPYAFVADGGISPIGDGYMFCNFVLLALLPTVVSNLTLILAIKNIGPTMTSILGSMEPLTAVVIGVLHFGELFDVRAAAGILLVITAVIIVILQSRHKRADLPAE